MSAPREAAGLTWRYDGNAWVAEDGRGRFLVIEMAEDSWTAVWFPVEESCGCGRGPVGGGDYPQFEAAAAGVLRLADAGAI